jgi:hypothetical protein
VTGWIVDTSVEHDHQLFSGYLKVSLEEVIIALRDDSHLLFNMVDITEGKEIEREAEFTLYPNGFSVNHFLRIIEDQRIWRVLNHSDVL